jgi:hypothetical protein
MFRGKTVHLALSLVFYSGLNVFGQWSAVNSGTTAKSPKLFCVANDVIVRLVHPKR